MLLYILGNNDNVAVGIYYTGVLVANTSALYVFDPKIIEKGRRCVSCLENVNWEPAWNMKEQICQDKRELTAENMDQIFIFDNSKCPKTHVIQNQR